MVGNYVMANWHDVYTDNSNSSEFSELPHTWKKQVYNYCVILGTWCRFHCVKVFCFCCLCYGKIPTLQFVRHWEKQELIGYWRLNGTRSLDFRIGSPGFLCVCVWVGGCFLAYRLSILWLPCCFHQAREIIVILEISFVGEWSLLLIWCGHVISVNWMDKMPVVKIFRPAFKKIC